ncbi:hypothetical protein [Nonomuraea sp. NPDC003754]
MGRRSELAALDIAHMTTTGGGLEVAIRRSKTDQDAIGEIVPLPHGSASERVDTRAAPRVAGLECTWLASGCYFQV